MKSDWSIRLFNPETDDYISYFSSFNGANLRDLDTIIVFEGMYGIGDYMKWYVHKDLKGLNLRGAGLHLRLMLEGNTVKRMWEDKYKIISIIYNENKDRYEVYAISPGTAILDKRLYEQGITSLPFKEDRTPADVLKEVLEDNNLINVKFYPYRKRGWEIKTPIDYNYNMLTFRRDQTIRDLINYICDANGYEWKIRKHTLYISRELPALERWRSGSYFGKGDDLSKGSFFQYYTGSTRPVKIFSHVQNKWRCVWAKHSVGKSGGVTQGCFAKIGEGRVPKPQYERSLRGDIEQKRSHKLYSKKEYESVGLGSILKDEGEYFVDEVSTEQKPKNLKSHYPYTQEFLQQQAFNIKEKPMRLYPYLDENAGLQFPSPVLDTTPHHSLLLNPYRRDESGIVGGYVPRKGLELPFKEKDDFRFTLPNGWTMYVDSEGNTLIQTDETTLEEKPEGDEKKNYIKIMKDGKIKLNREGTFLQLDSDGMFVGTDGKVEIVSDGDIITNGSKTKLQSGGTKLAHAYHTHGWNNHIHTVPTGALIGGPPINSNPTSSPNTEPCNDNTTNTEAD